MSGSKRRRAPLADRFWPKVNKDGPVPEERPELGPCWQWTASTTAGGYGQIRDGDTGRSMVYAHRVSYEWMVGPIPAGLQLDHLCRNRACVNPGHLEPVTNRENGLRGQSFAAINARKTHCPKGHEYTPENTAIDSKKGCRKCRACMRVRQASRPYQYKAKPKKARVHKTHCPQGHEYTPENTYTRPNGTRRCQACHRQREAARWAADPDQARAKDRARRAARKAVKEGGSS